MTRVVGDVAALQDSLVGTWLQRAVDRVQSSPAAHVAEMIRQARKAGVLRPVDGDVSDGFHTFNELYRHRMLLSAALWNGWYKLGTDGSGHDWFDPHKSRLHSDGEVPFGGGWFIIVAQLPTGQVSYHYPLEHWDLFRIPERERAAEWDGHSAGEAATRLEAFLS